ALPDEVRAPRRLATRGAHRRPPHARARVRSRAWPRSWLRSRTPAPLDRTQTGAARPGIPLDLVLGGGLHATRERDGAGDAAAPAHRELRRTDAALRPLRERALDAAVLQRVIRED